MTERDCLEMFALLEAAYPKEPMTDEQLTLYTELLLPYEIGRVRDAVLIHIQTSPWFPRISDIVGRVTKHEQLDADEAWGEVLTQIRKVGYYRTPEWSHPALADAIQAMGWQDLCMSDNAEADRAHFMKFYQIAQTRRREQKLVDEFHHRLPGLQRAMGAIGQPTGRTEADERIQRAMDLIGGDE